MHSDKRSTVLNLRAHAMRSAPTLSEQRLWQELRGYRLGVAFRRQLPIGRFIADFAAPAVMLVVEVDGGYHERRTDADAKRDDALRRLGWRVVRVQHEVVVHDITQALAAIRCALAGGE